MDIHEYQAKEILSNFNVQTLDGRLALKTSEAVAAYNELDTDVCVVKLRFIQAPEEKLEEL